jgi:replication fork clamp-binding protein CrfC
VGKFEEIPNTTFTNFDEVREKIDYLTDKICGKEKNIINKPIILNVTSSTCPNITIVDLPGITTIPVGGQPDNIYEVTKNMVMTYIKDERSIILCVIPANQDLTTSEALKITQETDPRGNRSLGCLTKIDIMDRGTNARQVLLNE